MKRANQLKPMLNPSEIQWFKKKIKESKKSGNESDEKYYLREYALCVEETMVDALDSVSKPEKRKS